MYILRLDDASEYMDVDKWNKMFELCDKYNIKPLVAVIPDNTDESLILKYEFNPSFWDCVESWKSKGYTIAMHGCNHSFISDNSGINPVNSYSEFAGIDLNLQEDKIMRSVKIFEEHNIYPNVFVAPAHTFDENTLLALKRNSKISIISDTIANDVYLKDGFYFIPQQSGMCRKLPFKVTTFCYHPNNMKDSDFENLESFLIINKDEFAKLDDVVLKNRRYSFIDTVYKFMYFAKAKMRRMRKK